MLKEKRARIKQEAESRKVLERSTRSQAIKKYVGIPRRKCARLGDICIGKKVEEVKNRLSFFPQQAAREVLEVIKSAESNFLFQNPNENTGLLIVKSILVDQGPTMRRMMYRARGRADRIKKRSSHIKVILEKK